MVPEPSSDPRGTKFPMGIFALQKRALPACKQVPQGFPSLRAGNGREKSGGGAPKKRTARHKPLKITCLEICF